MVCVSLVPVRQGNSPGCLGVSSIQYSCPVQATWIVLLWTAVFTSQPVAFGTLQLDKGKRRNCVCVCIYMSKITFFYGYMLWGSTLVVKIFWVDLPGGHSPWGWEEFHGKKPSPCSNWHPSQLFCRRNGVGVNRSPTTCSMYGCVRIYLDLLGTPFCNFVKVKSSVITNSQNMPVGSKQHIALHYSLCWSNWNFSWHKLLTRVGIWIVHIMYLLFWEDALDSPSVNKYWLNGYSFQHCARH